MSEPSREQLVIVSRDLLKALKRMDALVESLWKSVPWGKTFNLDVQLLNEAPLQAKRAIWQAEDVLESVTSERKG